MSETTERPRQQVAAPTKEQSRPLRELTKVGELFTNAEFINRINKAVPSIITPTMMLSTIAASVRRSPLLLECSVQDLAGKALMLAQAALPPDTPMQLAHLIPFKDKVWNPRTRQREEVVTCQVVIGYHGLLDLAYRSGKVAAVIGRVAWRDEVDSRMFDFEFGTEEHLRHVPSGRDHDVSPKAQADGTAELPAFAYAQATMTAGGIRPFEVWPMQKVLSIRNATPAYRYATFLLEELKKNSRPPPAGYVKAPWVAFLEKMAAKTVAKQLLNWLPRSIEYATIAALDDLQERRPIDLGPIIDSTDYVAAAADAAETSGDPGATFGMHETEDEPVDKGAAQQPKQQRASRATQQPKPEPTQDNGPPAGQFAPPVGDDSPPAQPATASDQSPQSGAQRAPEGDARTPSGETAPPPFAGQWLLDENGEPIGDDPIEDPLDYVRKLEERWQASSNREGLVQQNADGMEEASRASLQAAGIIATLSAPASLKIEIATERGGKPNLGQYMRDFRAAVIGLTMADYGDFIAENLPTMHATPLTTRSLLIKALVEHADKLGIPRPPTLSEAMKLQSSPAPPEGGGEGQQPASSSGSIPEKDRRIANNILEEAQRCQDANTLRLYVSGDAVKVPRNRWRQEAESGDVAKQAFLADIDAKLADRYKQLGGT